MICDFLNVFSFDLSMLGPDSLQWSSVERGLGCFLTWKWDPGQVAQPPACWFSFLYLFVVVVGLRCCAALLSLRQLGLLFIVVHKLLVAVASPFAEHRP